MAKEKSIPSLHVWVNEEKLGMINVRQKGQAGFIYDPAWIQKHPNLPISRSLPIQEDEHRGEKVETYFENLLPDSESAREFIAKEFGIRRVNTFDILAAIGRDCVGAIRIFPDEGGPVKYSNEREKLTDTEIANIIKNLTRNPLGDRSGEDFRISIAGVQNKTALLRIGNEWYQPKGSTPTTHILKPQIGIRDGMDLSQSVENEWYCMELCRELGLPTAIVEMVRFDDQSVLAVERFDRKTEGQRITRLIQEDFCQATGTPSHLKYENEKQGDHSGPGMISILSILNESTRREQDRKNFIKAQMVFYCLAAIDGHAKNFSIQHDDSGFFLCPLYDVMSAAPLLGKGMEEQKLKLAMAVGDSKHYRIKEIQRRHWFQLARKVKMPDSVVEECIHEISNQYEAALDRVVKNLPLGFPGHISDPISGFFRKKIKFLVE